MVIAKLFVPWAHCSTPASANETFLPPQSWALAAWRESRVALSARPGEVSVKRSSAMATTLSKHPAPTRQRAKAASRGAGFDYFSLFFWPWMVSRFTGIRTPISLPFLRIAANAAQVSKLMARSFASPICPESA